VSFKKAKIKSIFLTIMTSVVLVAALWLSSFGCKKETPQQVCTDCPPETTSHSFVWEKIDTVGGASSSSWNDVTVINDSLAYAVGEVYLYDSLGNVDPQPYNLAKWDGTKWSLQKVPYIYQGQPFYSPIQSVFGFNPNDIWACGNGVRHWNGSRFNEVPIPTSVWGPYGMNKIWGTSSTDIYIVGDGGNIAHFDGFSWQKVASPTTIILLDIWGSVDPQTGAKTILAVGSERGGSAFSLLQIIGLSATSISTTGLIYPGETSLWFSPGGPYYVIGNGVFTKKQLTDTIWREIDNPLWPYLEKIRGSGPNDVFIAGDLGFMLHYNGLTWKNYQDDGTLPKLQNGIWISVAIKGNEVVAVGLIGNRAAMLRGVRR
jgi:hypothetical protein